MTFNDFQRLCKQRKSVRFFSDQLLTKEEVNSLLQIALLSPSVENTQPWHFHIILNPKLCCQLKETSCYGNFVEGAGAFIIVTCEKSVLPESKHVLWNPRELEYSCVSAVENILLGATAMGLGSCWVSLQHGKAAEILNIPRTQVIIGGVMIGHSKGGEKDGAVDHEHKTLEEVCTWYE